ncbi:MAG: WD40 repeat domain-containing protein [Flavobacteriales bacterium]|nr:WD40 repeat domain-containing protein [Flavobacteriales bacterium]
MCSIIKKTLSLGFGILIFSVSMAAKDSIPQYFGNHQDDLESIAVSKNIVATGSWDKKIQLFKSDSTHTYIQELSGHNAAVSALRFTSDGKMLVSGGKDYKIIIWNTENPDNVEKVKELSMVHNAGINSIATGSLKGVIYSAGDDGRIVISYYVKGTSRFIDNKIPINEIAVSPNNQLIYCADESVNLKQYNMLGGLLREFKGHTDEINAVACSNDNLMVVTGSSDKTAIIWNVSNGKPKKVLSGHGWKITSVAFSPDNKYVITGGTDGMVKIWDANSGEEVESFFDEKIRIRQLDISSDLTNIYAAVQLNTEVQQVSYKAIVWNTGMNIKPAVTALPNTSTNGNTIRNGNTQNKETNNATSKTTSEPSKPSPSKNGTTNGSKEVFSRGDEVKISIEDE